MPAVFVDEEPQAHFVDDAGPAEGRAKFLEDLPAPTPPPIPAEQIRMTLEPGVTEGKSAEQADIERANKIGAPQVELNKQSAPFNLREHLSMARERPSDKLQYWAQRIPWSPAGIIQPLEVKSAADRIQAGIGEPKDFEKLSDFIVSAERQQNAGVISKAVDIATALPAFAAEFSATGGAFTGTRAAAQRAGLAALEESAKAVAGKAARYVATKAAEAPAFIAGAAAQTLANPKLIAENFVQNELNRVKFKEGDQGQIETIIKDDDVGFAGNLRNSFLKAGFDIGTEYAGELLHPLKAAIAARWMNAVPGRTPGALQKALDASGWHGVLGEMFEERLNEFAAPLYGENYQPPSPQQLMAEALAFSVPGTAERLLSGRGPAIEKGKENATTQRTEQPRTQRGEANAGIQPVGENRVNQPVEQPPRAPDSERNRVPPGEVPPQVETPPGTPVTTKAPLAVRILTARGVAPDVAEFVAARAGDKPANETAEDYRTRVNGLHDEFGFKVPTEVNPASSEASLRASAAAEGFTEEQIQNTLAKAKAADTAVHAANTALIGRIQAARQPATVTPEPPTAPPTLPDVAARFLPEDARRLLQEHAGNIANASAALGQIVQRHLDSGGQAILYVDGKAVPIVQAENGMLRDKKNQQWGTMPLFTGRTSQNRLDLLPISATKAPVPATIPPVVATKPLVGETEADLRERILGPPKDAPQEVVLERLKARLLEAKNDGGEGGGFHASGAWFDIGINFPTPGKSYINGRGITINVPTADLKRGDLSNAEILIGGKKTQIEDIAEKLPKAPLPKEEGVKPPEVNSEQAIRDLIDSPETTAQKSVKMRQMAEAAGIELKAMQERVEAVLVKMANEIARNEGLRPTTRFHALVNLYERQPLFSARTSTSVADQAYSTPAPIAFALRHMTGVTSQTPVYDATAGNGMLLLGSKLGESVANEINPNRAQALRDLGVGTVTQNDATKFVPAEDSPVVHLNPPFGSIPNTNYDGYGIRKLEHLISLKGLEAMEDGGSAAIILGAALHEKEQGKGAQWIFENYLYGHYNVVDNFEIAGDLYAKQGAKFPVRVLVIVGRKATPVTGEFAPKHVDRLTNWDDVWARAEKARNEAERIRSSLGTGGPGPISPGIPEGAQKPAPGPGLVPVRPGETAAPAGGGGLRRGNRGGKSTAPGGPTGVGEPVAPAGPAAQPGNAGQPAQQPGGIGQPTPPVEGRSSSGAEDEVPPSAGGTEAGGGTKPGVVSKPGNIKAADIGDLSLDDLDALLAGTPEEQPPPAPAPIPPAPEAPYHYPQPLEGQPYEQPPQAPYGYPEPLEGQPYETERATTPRPPRPPRKPPTQPPKKPKLSDVGKHLVEGAKSSFEALDQLFGRGTHMGALGPTFDENTYAAAKPHFAKAWSEYVKAGATLQEYIQYVLGRFGNGVRIYLKQFLADMQEEAKAKKEKPKATETQIPYEQRAEGYSFGLLTPSNIGNGTHAALDALKARVGPLTDFVADRLNQSPTELQKGLSGEQIDGVALAIDQIENGGALIIGDETGIGKGRQAAAIIRYAHLQGKIPVFFTKDPKLFTDMYGDLADIGTTIRPLIFGDPSKASIVNENGDVIVKAPTKKRQDAIMRDIQERGIQAAGYDAIFSTYSQVNVENERQRFLEGLAHNQDTILILDEAHEAAGDGESSMQAAFMQGGQVRRGSGADRTIVNKVGLLNAPGTAEGRGGVTYLSATYAKRPDNTPLYFRTALRKAAQSFQQVVDAMKKGGVALQQAVSEALAAAGQYVRRERDFSGVRYELKKIAVADEPALVQQVDGITDLLGQIVQFSHSVREAAQSAGGATSTAMSDNAIDVADFAALVHNQVGQLLLAAKADEVVKEAAEAHSRGEKPVIALMNTMESFLDQYTTEHNIKPGQPIQLRWHELLRYALSRTLRGKVQQPNGDTVIVQLTPEELGLSPQFEAIMEQIGELETEFPVSPIDYIVQQLEAKGVKTGELTGRTSGINYTDVKAGQGTYKRFPKANKNTLVNGFNGGVLNGLLLNASGSTGLSIHASEKFFDKKPRHMVIAQPALDINVFVQTLGRIKRTGMVLNGENPDGSKWGARYTHLVLPLQAEMRPAAVTNRKMKSLNANTTAESKSGVKIESADFLNKYGDEIVSEFLDENREWQPRLGLWIDHNQDGTVKVQNDIARKFTGRMSLMPNSQQEEAYNQIIPAYNELIDRLKTTGEYDLDIVVHKDWDGTQLSDDQLAPGTDESSIFTASVRAQRWEITDNRHVPTGEEMLEEFNRQTGGVEKLRENWQAQIRETEKQIRDRIAAADKAIDEAANEPDPTKRALLAARAQNEMTAMLQAQAKWSDTKDTLNRILSMAGDPVELEDSETHETFDGMLVGFKMPNLARGLRVSPSAYHLRYLIDAPGGKMFLRGSMFPSKWTQNRSDRPLSDFKGARAGQRYARWVVTGNPIKAYEATGGRGKMVRFQSRDGQTITGLIMPVKWDISKLASDPRLELVSGAAIANFLRAQRGDQNHAVESKSGIVRINRSSTGAYAISVPAARRTGGDYFLDLALRKIVGDFNKTGARMLAQVAPDKLVAAADRVMQIAGERLRVSGKVSPEMISVIEAANKPGGTASDVANRIAEALNRLKSNRRPGDLQLFGLVPLVWDKAIDIARGIVLAGGKVADAVAKAIEYIRANHKGDWDEAGARAALETAAQKPAATEEGLTEPAEGEQPPVVDDHWVPTQVKGVTWYVRDRDKLSPESTARSIDAAEAAFKAAGFDSERRTMFDQGDHQTKSILFIPETENADEKGRKLAEVLEREIATQREAGKGADHVSTLINSVREGFDQPGSAFRQMSQQVRNRLFALAQEEASWRGRALRALANSKADIIRIARNVDVYLQRIYSTAFADKAPGGAAGASDIADDLRASLREVLTDEEIDRLPELIADPAQRERIKAALKKALEKVAPKGAKRFGRRNWRTIESLIQGGILDDTEWFKDLARKRGWKVPTDAEIEQMRKLADEEQALRKPTDAELAKVGEDPKARERLLADIEAATRETRFKLQKRLAVMWSEMTKPVSLRNYWAQRQNTARFLNELMTANLLFRASFVSKQAIDVATQWFWRMPMRAIAQALTLRKNDLAAGKQVRFWDDAQAALKDIYGDSIKSLKVATAKARAALAGRVEIRNVDRLMGSVSALDRLWLRADRAAEDGRKAEAFMWRAVAAIGFSYKVAGAFDYLHGTPAEWNERRFRVIEALRETGVDPAAARVQAGWVMDGALAEYPEAVAMTRSMLEARGIPFTEQQLREDAWNMVERRQYQRIGDLGLPVDAIREHSELYRNTLGWNEREMRGPGGLVGTLVHGVGAIGEGIGIPLAMGRFGNAIAIGINRQLHKTPLYALANIRLPFLRGGQEPSPWSRTMTDIYERRLEAVAGTMLGSTLLTLAAAGLLKVWLKPPPDKEERELWEREGHKAGTVEIPLGDGKYQVWSLTAGPFALLAPYLAAGGAINDLTVKREKQQAKLNAEAAKKGLTPAQLPPPDISDWFGVAAQAAQASVLGNRTASGWFNSVTDYGTPNVKKFVASQFTPMVPGLPALQEVSRMAGVIIDPKKADVMDFLVPLPTSKARKYNMLGDPVGTQDDLQRVVQTLTGGTYPSISPGQAHEADAYKALFATGYRPPSIDPNAGHAIGGDFRPFTESELERYTDARSRNLREELGRLGPTASAKDAREAYQRANDAALRETGVTVATRTTTPSGATVTRVASSRGGVGVPTRTTEARSGTGGRAARGRLSRGLRGVRFGRRGLARASRLRLQPRLGRGRTRGLSRARVSSARSARV